MTGPQKPDGVVLTSGGNLSCKHIAQMVGPNNAADITASIEKVLNLCEGQRAATVAIPAIGTGNSTVQCYLLLACKPHFEITDVSQETVMFFF